jgi:tripartite-type tricarboxylate transporter receptor subunit TctC
MRSPLISISVIVLALAVEACSPAGPAPTPKSSLAPEATRPAASPAAAASAVAVSPVADPATTAAAQPRSTSDPSLALVWQGKTLTLVTGGEAGGGYDSWARMFARHLGKHLAGNPQIIVQNMQGASHRVATNFVYQARPDGLTIGLVDRYIPNYQLGGEGPAEGVRYDVTQMHWLGSAASTTQVLVVHQRVGATAGNLAPLRSSTVPVAQQSTGGAPHILQVILKEGLGWNLKTIVGFKSNPEIVLSIERGETDALISDWDTMARFAADQLGTKTFVPIVQVGPKKADPILNGVPSADELFVNAAPEMKQALDAAQVPFIWARPFFAPPGTPPNVVAGLRAAMMATMSDPEFLADADTQRLEVIATPGETLQEMIVNYMKTPKSVTDKIDELIKSDSPG